MRHQTDARVINVKKLELIRQIQENKKKHLEDYEAAVKAYREEAKKQLKNQLKRLANGELDIKVQLTTPQNKSEEYDKLVNMFEWEIKDEVELSQGEFNEYILDESPFSISAKFANNAYRS